MSTSFVPTPEVAINASTQLSICRQFLGDPLLEIRSLHRGLDLDSPIGETELRRRRLRQIALHLLHRAMQVVPEILLDQVNQRLDLLGLECLRAAAAQHVQHRVRAQKRQVVPVLQLRVYPVRHRRQHLVHRSRQRSASQGRGDQVPHNLGVERVARQPESAIAQQIRRPPAAFPDLRPHSQQRKVTGAAAEVADQNQLIVIERRLVIERRRHRFQFELDRFDSRPTRMPPSAALRKLVVLVFSAPTKRTGRPTTALRIFVPELSLRLLPQIPQNARNQILHRHPPAEHVRALQAPAGQEGLERLHQPALRLGREILLDRRRTAPAFRTAYTPLPHLFQVQQRAIRIRSSAGKRKSRQLNFARSRARATELFVVPKSMPIEKLLMKDDGN